MAVTIRDVAARADVSVATVSRALRSHPSISERTREHVVAVANEMGYVLPVRATSTRGESTRPRVALIVPFVGRWYFARVLEGAERVMHDRGIDLVVSRPVDSRGRRRALAEHLQDLAANGAVAVSMPISDDEVDALNRVGIPLVMIGTEHPLVSHVRIDDVAPGQTAARHLLELGHKRIGLVSEGPFEPWAFSASPDRRKGFLKALEDAQVPWDPSLEVHADFTARGAEAAVERLFEMTNPPTAIVAQSDEMAYGVMAAARRHGLRIPGDLSIVGIDDHEVAAAWDLTTVAQPVDTLGELAAWQIASRVHGEGNADVHRLVMPTSLVVRNSTARWEPSAAESSSVTN